MPSTRQILVDDRVGSRELLPELRRLSLPAKLSRLEFGDVSIPGIGSKGDVSIGIERKTIQDLLNSLASGRLTAHQLPGMVQTYDYRWIVIEGLWRVGRGQLIETWRFGGWKPAVTQMGYYDVDRYLITLEVKGGCWLRRTGSLGETCSFIADLHRWWGKNWKEHRGHLGLEKGLTADKVLYSKPTYPRLVANVLPGIGWEKSKAVARHFKTIEAMVGAGPGDWMKIPGIGKKLGTILPLILRGTRGVDRAREE